MDRVSETSRNDSVKCSQGDITGSLAATENSLVSEEGILYIDVDDDVKFLRKEQQHAVQNGETNNIEKISTIVRSTQSCELTAITKPKMNNPWSSSVTFKRSSVPEKQEFSNVDCKQENIEMDDGVGCEVVDSDNSDENDDDDDDDDEDDDDDVDEDYNLVMNMEVSNDARATEESPTAGLFVASSLPSAPTPAASLAMTSPPSLVPTVASATAAAVSSDHLPVQAVGVEPQPPKHPAAASQIRTEHTLATVASGVSSTRNPRSLPIHCVIEQTTPEAAGCPPNGCQHSRIVLDTYAILPGSTLFSDLVKTSLLRLGYSPGETVGAKGGIQLKHWKTLMFEAVTDDRDATVEEILGELTSVATLKIHLSSQVNNNTTNDDVKDRLLQLLLTKSIDFLVQAGCPIEKPFLEAISLGEISQSISEQVCTSFNDWYKRQKISTSSLQAEDCPYSALLKPDKPASAPSLQATVTPKSPLPFNAQVASPVMAKSETEEMKAQSVAAQINSSLLPRSSPLNLDVKKEPASNDSDTSSKLSVDSQKLQLHNHFFHNQDESDSVHRSKKPFDKSLDKNSLQPDLYKFSRSPNEGNLPSTLQTHPSNPYLGLMPGKTRIRTSFDPEHEIPRLQKWFGANQHPTREQMMRFMHELNGLESRKGRRPLDLTNIIYWFKNARAAQRRATRALDDSFENEENIEMNSIESGSSATESVPPFLPNKNAVYMIPFHPYPHLVPSVGDNGDREHLTATDVDEPYDLSLAKRPTSEISKINDGAEKGDNHFLSLSTTPSPTKSSSASSECENQSNSLKKRKSYCPPRFPALLDVAAKMRQEIPHRSDDLYFNNNSSNNTSNQNDLRGSLYRSKSGSVDMEHSIKNEDIDSNFSDPPTPFQNGEIVMDKFSASLKMKHEDNEYFHHHDSRQNYRQLSHTSRDSGLELGQVKKENDRKVNSSDEDDGSSNGSYNSEEELKLRIKQNAAAAAVVDYASAMHSNVSRLTAANMAALSLAQMGQPLHIPQLTSSLAMAYYPMDPRFYSQSAVQHSLSASPPTSLAGTHTSHLAQLSLRQSQDCAHMDSRSPLPSPSLMQQSLNQLNHHQQQQQQQSPQHPHHRHSSEPRKRRTRVFIDPLTEIPKLEKWFTEDTHPSAFMIDKYCEELNKCEYRHKFPKLEPKNVQLWFKNHRAKVKRMKVSSDDHMDHNGSGGHDDDIDD